MSEKLIQVGDEVTIHIPDDNWDWGYHPVEKQDGVKATVIGFSEMHYTKISNFGLKPGIYDNESWIKIRTESGKEYAEFSGRLKLIDRDEYKRRKEVRRNNSELFEKTFIRDLPITEFCEGDHVLVCGDRRMIVGIEYNWKKDDQPWTYRISDGFGAGWHTYAKENEIKLIERGNVWKYYNGEKPSFENIKDEAIFFIMIGHTKSVRNPANKLYKWSKEEILQAINDGIVDGFSIGNGLFGGFESNMRIESLKFNDRDLGERVRHETLKGFDMEVVE